LTVPYYGVDILSRGHVTRLEIEAATGITATSVGVTAIVKLPEPFSLEAIRVPSLSDEWKRWYISTTSIGLVSSLKSISNSTFDGKESRGRWTRENLVLKGSALP
jgi:hypothetical protein